jgi:hypothetical protein
MDCPCFTLMFKCHKLKYWLFEIQSFIVQILVDKGLKLHASRWAKIFQENQYWEKCTKILRKVKSFKIQVIFYTLCVVYDWFCCNLSPPYFYCITYTIRAVFAYVDHFLLIFLDCKCHGQYVNYFICSPHIILLGNTLPKFLWKLTNLEGAALNYIR